MRRERDEEAGEERRDKAELSAGEKRFVPECDWGFCVSYGQNEQVCNILQKKFKEMEVWRGVGFVGKLF